MAEKIFVLNGRRVDRASFFRAAGRAGVLGMHGVEWETSYGKDVTTRRCDADGFLFMTISTETECSS